MLLTLPLTVCYYVGYLVRCLFTYLLIHSKRLLKTTIVIPVPIKYIIIWQQLKKEYSAMLLSIETKCNSFACTNKPEVSLIFITLTFKFIIAKFRHPSLNVELHNIIATVTSSSIDRFQWSNLKPTSYIASLQPSCFKC